MNIYQAIISTAAFLIVSWFVSLFIVIGYMLGFESGLTFFKSLSGLILIFLVYWFLLRRQSIEKPIFQLPSVLQIGFAVVLGFGLVWIQPTLTAVYNHLAGLSNEVSIGLPQLSVRSIVALGSFVFIPIAHELFFRRFIQNQLQLRYGDALGLFAAASVFALARLPLFSGSAEFPGLDGYQAFIAFFVGLVAGYSYQKSKSI